MSSTAHHILDELHTDYPAVNYSIWTCRVTCIPAKSGELFSDVSFQAWVEKENSEFSW